MAAKKTNAWLNYVSEKMIHINKTGEGKEFANISIACPQSKTGLATIAVNLGQVIDSTKKDGIYTRLKTVSKSSTRKYVDAGLASGEKYYYTIRAYRTANGVKTYSNYNTIKAVRVK